MSFFDALRRPVRIGLAGLSAVGLAISCWAHAVALFGLDPRTYFPRIWVVEPALTLVVLPMGFALLRRGVNNNPFHLTKGERVTVYWLLGYYAFQFYRFLYRASQELHSSDTWQMFTAGWLVLFLLAFFYYLQRNPSSAPAQREA
jgi:hypothetical protein